MECEFSEKVDNGGRARWEGEEQDPRRKEDREEFGEEDLDLELEEGTKFGVDLKIQLRAPLAMRVQ